MPAQDCGRVLIGLVGLVPSDNEAGLANDPHHLVDLAGDLLALGAETNKVIDVGRVAWQSGGFTAIARPLIILKPSAEKEPLMNPLTPPQRPRPAHRHHLQARPHQGTRPDWNPGNRPKLAADTLLKEKMSRRESGSSKW